MSRNIQFRLNIRQPFVVSFLGRDTSKNNIQIASIAEYNTIQHRPGFIAPTGKLTFKL